MKTSIIALIVFTLMTLISTPITAKEICWTSKIDGKTYCKQCTIHGRCTPAKEKMQ